MILGEGRIDGLADLTRGKKKQQFQFSVSFLLLYIGDYTTQLYGDCNKPL